MWVLHESLRGILHRFYQRASGMHRDLSASVRQNSAWILVLHGPSCGHSCGWIMGNWLLVFISFATKFSKAWRRWLCCLCPCSFSVCWWDSGAPQRGREVGSLGLESGFGGLGEEDRLRVCGMWGLFWRSFLFPLRGYTHSYPGSCGLLRDSWVVVGYRQPDPLKGMPAQFTIVTCINDFSIISFVSLWYNTMTKSNSSWGVLGRVYFGLQFRSIEFIVVGEVQQ